MLGFVPQTNLLNSDRYHDLISMDETQQKGLTSASFSIELSYFQASSLADT
jgi:hypothetical protein